MANLPSRSLVGDVWKFTQHAAWSVAGCDPNNCNDPSHYFYEVITPASPSPVSQQPVRQVSEEQRENKIAELTKQYADDDLSEVTDGRDGLYHCEECDEIMHARVATALREAMDWAFAFSLSPEPAAAHVEKVTSRERPPLDFPPAEAAPSVSGASDKDKELAGRRWLHNNYPETRLWVVTKLSAAKCRELLLIIGRLVFAQEYAAAQHNKIELERAFASNLTNWNELVREIRKTFVAHFKESEFAELDDDEDCEEFDPWDALRKLARLTAPSVSGEREQAAYADFFQERLGEVRAEKAALEIAIRDIINLTVQQPNYAAKVRTIAERALASRAPAAKEGE